MFTQLMQQSTTLGSLVEMNAAFVTVFTPSFHRNSPHDLPATLDVQRSINTQTEVMMARLMHEYKKKVPLKSLPKLNGVGGMLTGNLSV